MTDAAHIRRRLAEARDHLLASLADLDDEQWRTVVFSDDAAEGDPFTIADILRHLVDAERAFVYLLGRIRDGGPGASPDLDLYAWNRRTVRKMADHTPPELLAELAASRDKLWGLLDTFTEDDWRKKGRHPNKDVGVVDLARFVRIIGLHEHSHSRDIRRALDRPAR